MTNLINKHSELEKRRLLRRNQTYVEQDLWKYLRNKGIGCKFKRQVIIGKYVVDFYCTKAKLGGLYSYLTAVC